MVCHTPCICTAHVFCSRCFCVAPLGRRHTYSSFCYCTIHVRSKDMNKSVLCFVFSQHHRAHQTESHKAFGHHAFCGKVGNRDSLVPKVLAFRFPFAHATLTRVIGVFLGYFAFNVPKFLHSTKLTKMHFRIPCWCCNWVVGQELRSC